jgi:hypothetical protein
MRTGTTERFSGLRLMIILIALPVFLSLTGCEQIFTYSPLTWAQRDPSNLSTSGKISYATSALSSGDAETLKDAYNAIKDSDDPEVQYLASKVAVGASGINDAIETALSSLASGADPSAIVVDDLVADMDVAYLRNAGDRLAEAELGGAEISSEDYVTAAAALILSHAAGTANAETYLSGLEFSTLLSPAPTDYASAGSDEERAAYLFSQSGYSATDMNDLLALVGG